MQDKKAPYSVEWLGTAYRVLLTPEETDGHLGLFESLDQPGWSRSSSNGIV
ncbi:MAG: hypothetical protein K8H74_09760 [Notoacmeibacter sp.]|nr:hypothetical protein [Notoacmeibacter sp.]